jgi:hypothetical protein
MEKQPEQYKPSEEEVEKAEEVMAHEKKAVKQNQEKLNRENIIPEGKEGHDFCHYCGADNGLNGEYRQGFDCYQCLSN